MKRLILMRHAKSDWGTMAQKDYDRPLNPRGRNSADALGNWLRDNDLVPDHVLVSAANRTRETFARLRLENTPSTFIEKLYHSSPDTIMSEVMARTEDTILVIAHNPGIGALAYALGAKLDDRELDRYPTGATLVVDFDIEDWPNALTATPVPRTFTVPRRLIVGD